MANIETLTPQSLSAWTGRRIWPRCAPVVVPKREDSRSLQNVAELTAGKVGLIALIESPAVVQSLGAIASVPQVQALVLGSEDYSGTLGVSPNWGHWKP